MKSVLFAYDFPHKKSSDFLLRMMLAGHPPALVVGAPWKRLDIPGSRIRTGHSVQDALHVQDLAKLFDIEYVVQEHNDPALARRIRQERLDLGVVGGARILKAPVIDAFTVGVLNIHPGLIPENRGLDNVQYAIYRDLPMALTTHLIDARVDAGGVLERFLVPVTSDDTLIDIGQRLLEEQNVVLPRTLDLLASGACQPVPVPDDHDEKNVPGDPAVDDHVAEHWPEWVARWAVDRNGWRAPSGEPLQDGEDPATGSTYEPYKTMMREVRP